MLLLKQISMQGSTLKQKRTSSGLILQLTNVKPTDRAEISWSSYSDENCSQTKTNNVLVKGQHYGNSQSSTK